MVKVHILYFIKRIIIPHFTLEILILTIKILKWSDLIPDTDNYQEIFKQLDYEIKEKSQFSIIQPRLHYALKQLLYLPVSPSCLLVKAPEKIEYLSLIAENIHFIQPKNAPLHGGEYYIKDNEITFQPILNIKSDFTTTGKIIVVDWTESEQLFGCLRQFNGNLSLHPGLVHQANGGVLIISLRTLLMQPLLWLRLKKIIEQQFFDWITFDEAKPLPVSIPSMPLSLKVILVGNRKSLANFQEIEPELSQHAIYSEFEDTLQISVINDIIKWCQWVINIAYIKKFPLPTTDAWPILIREAVRYSGDQKAFPLCPLWLIQQLREVIPISGVQYCNGEQLAKMFSKRKWRENFLEERIQNEIFLNQILVETKGKRIGQINALSIIEFPGYPKVFGEPSRISCVVHIGDSGLIDIESKTELGSNIYKKSIMIMWAFLMGQLKLEQQIPFSISLTFEQSYIEIDGDSASMAILCALISALADVPLNQNIAITGSVDQFGRVQPVSGLNEKIESFFTICNQRGLTGEQGVIIPETNIHHLSLHQEILNSVKRRQFSIWTIENIKDALFLLTNLPWDGKGKETLLNVIQDRITYITKQNVRHWYCFPLFFRRWLNWFKQD